jgi:hypothetical protein
MSAAHNAGMLKLNRDTGRMLGVIFSLLVIYALTAITAALSFSTLFPRPGTY